MKIELLVRAGVVQRAAMNVGRLVLLEGVHELVHLVPQPGALVSNQGGFVAAVVVQTEKGSEKS